MSVPSPVPDERATRPSDRRARVLRWLAAAVAAAAAATAAGVLLLALVFALAYANLPPIDSLTDYRPKIPLRVWTRDGVLIGEFGEERRNYVAIHEVPEQLKQAILAAEDDAFYRHSGVDYVGLLRAALANFASGRRGQGGSTITMQVARNFYLSSERSYIRKIYEIALAHKIESSLSKDRILEVYVNQIFLGQRAYGFAAAAQTYFGKSLQDLGLAEMAVLAGLPVAPSAYNPWVNPKRAKGRQQYVLARMLALGQIDTAAYEAALAEELRPRPAALEWSDAAAGPSRVRLHAEFAAETARQLVFEVFQEETYTRGLNVVTTLDSAQQQSAYDALRAQVVDYDRRHGYRGPEAYVDLGEDPAAREQRIDEALNEAIESPGLAAAVVLEANPRAVSVTVGGGNAPLLIEGRGLRFVASALSPKAPASRRIVPGALVRLARQAGGWEITQLPQVEAAFVSASTRDGAVLAWVGGFDFTLSKFNHVTQAWRQPGSSVKPFIYAAALERGVMPSTLVNDAPLIIEPELTGGQLWEPKNYDGKFDGPLRLREGLARSKNLVSVRLLQTIGPAYAQSFLTRFGFDPQRHPAYLTMALGAGSVTPWQQLSAYAVFATGGYALRPYLIDSVRDANGKVLMQARPERVGEGAPRVLDARTAFVMDSLLRDVARVGTAARAASLKRNDIAGKTGTTNDAHDAWFAGYGGGVVAVSWLGYDQPRPLGERETGGGLALPIWIDYMKMALRGAPDVLRDRPPGVVSLGGEVYLEEFQPGQGIAAIGLEDALPPEEQKRQDEVRDQIF